MRNPPDSHEVGFWDVIPAGEERDTAMIQVCAATYLSIIVV